MDVIPVSYVDTIAQMHDNNKQNNRKTTEHSDYKQMLFMLEQWGHTNEGDGWTGPTWFEKRVTIPFLLGLMDTKDTLNQSIEQNICMRILTPWSIKLLVKNYKQIYPTNDAPENNNMLKYAKEEPLKALKNMIEAVQKTLPVRDFTGNNIMADATRELAKMQRDERANVRKDPDNRPAYTNNTQLSTKKETWEHGMSRYQWVIDANKEGVGYNVWLICGQDNRINPIIAVDDYNGGLTPDYRIPLSANPMAEVDYILKDGSRVRIPNYLRWNLDSIDEQKKIRGINEDGTLKKKESEFGQ